MGVNLWDDADKIKSDTPAAPKEQAPTAPTMTPKEEKVLEPVWSVDVEFDDKVIKDFPLTYVVQHNSPWVYFEVLKTLVPPIMPAKMTAQEATTPTEDNPTPVVFKFTDAINRAIDKYLVPKNPIYANAKNIFITLAQNLHAAANKLQDGKPETQGNTVDLMDVVVREHPEAMANVTPNSPAWNAIKGKILKELNQNSILADANGQADPLQQKNIEGRGGPIRAIILNTLRALGLIRI